ncbi:unnamed protein product [Candidula unifasciata]|uniref:Protein phosphatase 1 regulatory subunit 14B n=1 Tax=Candidula unifasciata TaxID=100452 RepID=A0A8S3ZF20_9EUPU|nr:unnamed protein product [Candidula unifasciata]
MSRNPFRKTVGLYEVMATPYTTTTHDTKGETAYTKPNQMDTSYSPPPKPRTQESHKNVEFNLKDQHKENKKKYLTAKYGAHQMFLIKKRLGVEMWIFDELRKLYNCENDDHDCELELEDILNLDTDTERRDYALQQLQDVKQPPDVVNAFIEELLQRAKTL